MTQSNNVNPKSGNPKSGNPHCGIQHRIKRIKRGNNCIAIASGGLN
jgi:hypothetical protein